MHSPSPLVLLAFLIGTVPVVWQDLRTLSVSQWALGFLVLGWATVSWWTSTLWIGAAALSAGVLTVGAAFLLLAPGSLGEADVVYMAALAWLLPFWGFLFAIGLACVLGLTAFGWLSRWGQRDVRSVPLAYLPCLALGGFGALGGLV